MSFDLEKFSSIVQNSKELWDFVQAVVDAGVVIRQGAILDHESSELEYQIHLNIGDMYSRTKVTEKFKAKFQSYLQGSISIGEAIDVWGIGFQNNENLKELGVIKIESGIARISFHDILEKVKSNLLILTVRKRFPRESLANLVSVHFSQNMKAVDNGTRIVGFFEVGLDYANLWKGSLDSFAVKNIVCNFTLKILDETIEGLIPVAFHDRILNVYRKVRISEEAIKFISVVSKTFLIFQSEEFEPKLRALITIDPASIAELTQVIPKLESCELGGVPYPVILPGSLSGRLKTSLREGEVYSKGGISLDMVAFNRLMKDLIGKIERDTKNLKI